MNRPPPPGPLAHDEEGDPLPQPEPKSDLADLIALAEWARQKDFALTGPIRVGKIVIQGFQDIRQLRRLGAERSNQSTGAGEPSIWDMTMPNDPNE